MENHPDYPGFKPETKILPRGSVLKEGALALPCDILYERDISVQLRDGTTIYVDLYRPPGSEAPQVPVIVCAGPFGKLGGFNRARFDQMPYRMGIPQCTVSSLEKFEGLDPAYWCLHGYAIAHPDVRGSWMSEGDAHLNCTLDGQDGYDLVEWLAAQSWCNGKVSYAGNSWLSQTQWFIGAEQPPHLACLAPWEGWSDLYNDDVMRGGIMAPEFQQNILNESTPCRGKAENVTAMAAKYPLWNEYWEDRKAKLDRITVPMYVVSSWTNLLHTRGTFKGYLGVSTPKMEKWLRVHNSHEWPDLYYPQNTEDLRKFYDYYLKGIKNDWIYTPRVRMCVLNPGESDLINRPEEEFPLARELPTRLFLDCANSRLQMDASATVVEAPSSTTFDARTGKTEFFYTCPDDMELTGFFALKLWVEAVDTDDLDLFVKVSKLDADGQLLETTCVDAGYLQPNPDAERHKVLEGHRAGSKAYDLFFSEGSTGRLRVSHRELDEAKSTPSQPVHTHRKEEKLGKGAIVPVVIEMWPHGMIWKRGQMLKLTVAGYNTRPEHTPMVKPPTYNKGTAVIHSGGKYDSHLLVPLIPAPR